jgi:hypothetical protein
MLQRFIRVHQSCRDDSPQRLRPVVEQLEERLAPAAHVASAAPTPVDTQSQTIPALVQAVRGQVEHSAAALVLAVSAASSSAGPSALITVEAPQPLLLDRLIVALPAESPALALADVDAAPSALEEALIVDPAAPPTGVTSEWNIVVVVTTVESQPEFVVPASSEFHAEPARVPSIPLAIPAGEREAIVEAAAAHDHLPMLVWMVGMASLVALRAERLRPSDAVYV